MKELFGIIFEDDDIVVIDKPAGLLTLPDRFHKELPNLRGLLSEKYGQIFVVHRLDKDTSGVMIFAKNADAHRHLNDQFENHTVEKIYHAIVKGVVSDNEMLIDIPIAPDQSKKGLMRPSARGKEALTTIRVLQRFRVATLVECVLHTGRQHQIRVHCSAVGHPLLIDPDYDGGEEFLLSSIKKKYNLAKNTDERPLMSRLTLHSTSLEVIHPRTNEKRKFSSEYPKDFRALVQTLTKYAGTGKNSPR